MEEQLFKKMSHEPKCSTFHIEDELLFVWARDTKLLSILNTTGEKVLCQHMFEESFSKIYPMSSKRYLLINGNGLSWIILEKFELEPIDLNSKIRFSLSQKPFFSHYAVTSEKDFSLPVPKHIGLYNLESRKSEWKVNINNRYVYFDNQLFISDIGTNGKWQSICRLDVKDGQIQWILKTDSIFVKILGVYKQILICKFEDYTLGVDISTGKIIWKNKNCLIYSEIKQKIYFIGTNVFQEVSPEDGQILRKIEGDYFSEIGIESIRQTPRIIGNHLITNDNNGKKLGAFNLESLQFDWFYELSEGAILGDERFMITKNNSLYFLDTNNNLRIFRYFPPAGASL